MEAKRLIIKIDTDLHKKVKILAARNEESMATLISRAIEEYIERKGGEL